MSLLLDVTKPRSFRLDYTTGVLGPYQHIKKVHLNKMVAYFVNKEAIKTILSSGENPLIYETQIIDWPSKEGIIKIGSTTIYPGEIGDELYHNRGHYHQKDQTSEIYIGLKGRGRIVMQKEDGKTRILPLELHDVAHIPPGWAHRVINIGRDKMSFMFACLADAGSNYEPIKERGFKKILVKKDEKIEVTENPFF